MAYFWKSNSFAANFWKSNFWHGGGSTPPSPDTGAVYRSVALGMTNAATIGLGMTNAASITINPTTGPSIEVRL